MHYIIHSIWQNIKADARCVLVESGKEIFFITESYFENRIEIVALVSHNIKSNTSLMDELGCKLSFKMQGKSTHHSTFLFS